MYAKYTIFYIKQDYKYWAAKSLANYVLSSWREIDLPVINYIKVSYHYLPTSVVTHCLPCFVRHVLTIFLQNLPNLVCTTCIKRNQKCNDVFFSNIYFLVYKAALLLRRLFIITKQDIKKISLEVPRNSSQDKYCTN